MEEGYRIPDISEFVQGFKYEYRSYKKGDKTWGLMFLDRDDNRETKWSYAENDMWDKRKVWWDREPKLVELTDENGISWSYMECKQFDLSPPHFRKEDLEQGLIRVKI